MVAFGWMTLQAIAAHFATTSVIYHIAIALLVRRIRRTTVTSWKFFLWMIVHSIQTHRSFLSRWRGQARRESWQPLTILGRRDDNFRMRSKGCKGIRLTKVVVLKINALERWMDAYQINRIIYTQWFDVRKKSTRISAPISWIWLFWIWSCRRWQLGSRIVRRCCKPQSPIMLLLTSRYSIDEVERKDSLSTSSSRRLQIRVREERVDAYRVSHSFRTRKLFGMCNGSGEKSANESPITQLLLQITRHSTITDEISSSWRVEHFTSSSKTRWSPDEEN